MPRLSLTAILIFVLSAGCGAQAQSHPASTPEERARAAQIAEALEANPTDPSLREDAAWLVRWTADIPDLTVSLCSANMPWKGEVQVWC